MTVDGWPHLFCPVACSEPSVLVASRASGLDMATVVTTHMRGPPDEGQEGRETSVHAHKATAEMSRQSRGDNVDPMM
jgi:hypothetical protein